MPMDFQDKSVAEAHRLPSPRRKGDPLPLWLRVGDGIAELIIAGILVGGFLSQGYAIDVKFRAWAWIACGVLGCWSAVGLAVGRWGGSSMAASRLAMILLLVPLIWCGIQRIPFPASAVTRVSSYWRETQQTFREAGLTPQDRIPLAHSPRQAERGWNQFAAATLFFSAVCMLTARRRCSLRLIGMVAVAAVVESLWGLANHTFGNARASGAIYNANHHAAFIIMGLPLYFARLIQWKRYSPALQDQPIIGGSSPALLLIGIGFVAVVGWIAALSRGSILFGGSIIALWLSLETFVAWREMRERDTMDIRPSLLILSGGGLLLLVVAMTLLLFTSSSLEVLLERGSTVTDELNQRGRLELWRAALAALAHSPWTGLGLGGTEGALNQYSQLPMSKIPIWAHNDPVQWVTELGIPVSVIALIVLGLLLGRVTLNWSRDLGRVSWALGLTRRAALVGVLVTLGHALTDFHLRIPMVGFAFLILLGLAINPGALLISPRMYSRLANPSALDPRGWFGMRESPD